MKSKLKELFNYSDYEIEQLSYLFRSIFSELSKFFLFLLIFYNSTERFSVAILFMWICRSLMGGIHFKHYFSCFFASFIYLCFCQFLPDYISVYKPLALLVIILCLIIGQILGPILSLYRRPPSRTKVRFITSIYSFLILVFFVVYVTHPQQLFLEIGFWSIVIHTLQIIIAKILRKEKNHEQNT